MLTLEHFFVKVLEQMSVINFMNYSLSTAAEGFMPSHAPFKNNSSLIFSSVNSAKERKKQVRITKRTPLFWVCAYGTKGGSLGPCLILSVMPNAAPDKRHGFHPWVGKIPWGREWQLTPVFLPGEFHEQRSLAGYSPWDCKRVGHN